MYAMLALRLSVLLALVAVAAQAPGLPKKRDAPGRCAPKLTRTVLDRSLSLGTRFLLANQLKAGNFRYAYDWRTKQEQAGDSQVRQAGAAWALALIHQHTHQPTVRAAAERAIRFFKGHSRTTVRGERYIVYPGETVGAVGTVALVALAHIDLLRSLSPPSTSLRRDLDAYLAFLRKARRSSGQFHGHYQLSSGTPFGPPSPYFDGEALLALVKASKYLGRKDLRALARSEADVGYRRNVLEARALDADSTTTKGYYQWSSMAYYELATSGWPNTRKYGDWLLELADWMIDTHRTLSRRRNTAYAYEGIIPAYALARARLERKRARKLGCTIDKGMARLSSWQVGSPIANARIAAHPTRDPLAVGGVQNHAREPLLRIDVTQHQMHAVLLARLHRFVH